METFKELSDKVVQLAREFDVKRLDNDRGFQIDAGDLCLQMIFRVNCSLRLELDLVVDGYLWHGETIKDHGGLDSENHWKRAYHAIADIERKKNSDRADAARAKANEMLK